jgi:peptide/nickel transport system ATP-binding protein
MYQGKLVETASCEALFAAPVHPYTRALLCAVPRIPPVAPAAESMPLVEASAAEDLSLRGCTFRNRCPYALPLCSSNDPALAENAAGHWVACHRSHETLNPVSLTP